MLHASEKEQIGSLRPIGVIRSPYKEKFSIPRQPNLVPAAEAQLHLFPPYGTPESVRGLEQFSHLWVMFLFHHTQHQPWHPTVRPPRLGGNKRIGTFASRSMFRPNPLGLSAVELRGITVNGSEVILHLGSLDLVDGTPVVDIKPYLPYSDAYPNANAAYATAAPEPTLTVTFSPEAQSEIHNQLQTYPHLADLISQVLSQDPRPAYKKNKVDLKMYYSRLYEFSVAWQVIDRQVIVLHIEKERSDDFSDVMLIL